MKRNITYTKSFEIYCYCITANSSILLYYLLVKINNEINFTCICSIIKIIFYVIPHVIQKRKHQINNLKEK